MKRLIKAIKFIGYSFLAFFITANLYIVLSGKFYIYKGVANTYLVGETGPSIYDLDVFPYEVIHFEASKTAKIKEHKAINSFLLTNKQRSRMENLGTKAFLVFKNDVLMYEEYWGGHTKETVSNSFSVAKTMVAMLIGIAIEDGAINSVDDKVCDYLPDFCKNGKDKISIHHLLTMSSGLDWSESGKNPLSDNAESYYGSNLYNHVLGQSVESSPGKVFRYQSGNSQLLGYILEAATKQNLSDYAEDKIWKKMGAEHDAFWSLDKENGDEKAFCCMYASTRDFARLGMVLLNEGNFNNNQIITSEFYNAMVTPVPLLTKEKIPNYRYGLHTWIYMDEQSKVNYFRGIKGQFIITIPDEEIVIVRIGDRRSPNFERDENWTELELEKNKFKIGHPIGFDEYLELGREILKSTGLK